MTTEFLLYELFEGETTETRSYWTGHGRHAPTGDSDTVFALLDRLYLGDEPVLRRIGLPVDDFADPRDDWAEMADLPLPSILALRAFFRVKDSERFVDGMAELLQAGWEIAWQEGGVLGPVLRPPEGQTAYESWDRVRVTFRADFVWALVEGLAQYFAPGMHEVPVTDLHARGVNFARSRLPTARPDAVLAELLDGSSSAARGAFVYLLPQLRSRLLLLMDVATTLEPLEIVHALCPEDPTAGEFPPDERAAKDKSAINNKDRLAHKDRAAIEEGLNQGAPLLQALLEAAAGCLDLPEAAEVRLAVEHWRREQRPSARDVRRAFAMARAAVLLGGARRARLLTAALSQHDLVEAELSLWEQVARRPSPPPHGLEALAAVRASVDVVAFLARHALWKRGDRDGGAPPEEDRPSLGVLGGFDDPRRATQPADKDERRRIELRNIDRGAARLDSARRRLLAALYPRGTDGGALGRSRENAPDAESDEPSGLLRAFEAPRTKRTAWYSRQTREAANRWQERAASGPIGTWSRLLEGLSTARTRLDWAVPTLGVPRLAVSGAVLSGAGVRRGQTVLLELPAGDLEARPVVVRTIDGAAGEVVHPLHADAFVPLSAFTTPDGPAGIPLLLDHSTAGRLKYTVVLVPPTIDVDWGQPTGPRWEAVRTLAERGELQAFSNTLNVR